MNPLECQSQRGHPLHCYRKEEQLHCSLLEMKNREINSRVLFSETLARQMWEDLFMKAIKIICSVKQNLNLRDRNGKLDLSIIVSMSCSNMLMLKDWNYKTRNTRIERGQVALKEEKVPLLCYLWKEKGQCSKRDQCSFRHESNDRAQKPDHNAATPSEPSFSRGRSVLKKRSIQAKSNHGAIHRQPCRYYFKGFTKQKGGAKPEISVCSRIIRLMNNQTKKRKKGYYSHKRRECDDKNAVAIVKIVPQLGCVSQDSKALVSQRGKQSRGNPMEKVLGSTRKVRFTQSALRQASIREKKGPSLGKRQVSPYAVNFEDQFHEETARQERCARSRAWNFAKNIYKLKEQHQVTFYSPAEEWVLPAGSTNEPVEREFVVDSGASMHMVSNRDFNSVQLETMRTSRSPTTVMTANGEVQTTEEATVYVKELDSFVTVMLIEKNSRSSFSREAHRGSRVFLPLDQRTKTTSHKKRQKN